MQSVRAVSSCRHPQPFFGAVPQASVHEATDMGSRQCPAVIRPLQRQSELRHRLGTLVFFRSRAYFQAPRPQRGEEN